MLVPPPKKTPFGCHADGSVGAPRAAAVAAGWNLRVHNFSICRWEKTLGIMESFRLGMVTVRPLDLDHSSSMSEKLSARVASN
jgi:hypothetical protein